MEKTSSPTQRSRPTAQTHNNEYGPSNFNIPKRFTWVFSYVLPTMGGGWQKLKNGWGFDSTVTLQTGQPFTLNYNGEDDYSGSGEGYDRPDVVGPITYNYGDPNNFLNLSFLRHALHSLILDSSITGRQRIACLGRGTSETWDATRCKVRHSNNGIWRFTREHKITERLNLQLRAEFFNLLNHPNFSNPLLPAFIADPAGNVNQQGCGCGFTSTAETAK